MQLTLLWLVIICQINLEFFIKTIFYINAKQKWRGPTIYFCFISMKNWGTCTENIMSNTALQIKLENTWQPSNFEFITIEYNTCDLRCLQGMQDSVVTCSGPGCRKRLRVLHSTFAGASPDYQKGVFAVEPDVLARSIYAISGSDRDCSLAIAFCWL